jgi:hypothetical protein
VTGRPESAQEDQRVGGRDPLSPVEPRRPPTRIVPMGEQLCSPSLPGHPLLLPSPFFRGGLEEISHHLPGYGRVALEEPGDDCVSVHVHVMTGFNSFRGGSSVSVQGEGR